MIFDTLIGVALALAFAASLFVFLPRITTARTTWPFVAGGFAFALFLFVFAPHWALAQAVASDQVQWGDAVADVAAAGVPTVKSALTIAVMGVLLKYAGPFGMFIRQNYVSDLVGRAVDFAFASTAGAMRGKTLNVSTMPEFMRNVVRYANGNFPWILRAVIKRVPGLVEMALARIAHEVPAEFQYTPRFVSEHGIDLEAPALAK